ncbi:putative reverse transcriptase domain-containing protein, partial [Tanacetum coccineum]
PMDAEYESGKQKSPQKSLKKSPEKRKSAEKMKEDDVVKEPGTKRKKSIPRKSTRKRQKLEEDAEKEELKGFLDIIPREEVPIEVKSISTKFPIMDWKTYILTETFMYYQVFRGDGSSKNYKILSEMLKDFDRLDVEELYRLVKSRYSASSPDGFDLMLWEDLHTLFEPDEEDEIWKDQHEYKLLSWRLYDFCGIHILLMENGLAIHMLTEKKYPLSQEMISKMLKKKLEVDHESSQAIELLRRGINKRSLVHSRYNKTPYELLKNKKPNVQYFQVFGMLCYPTNDRDDLRKIKPKPDISIFIGYSKSSRGFRIYNHRTRKIIETIYVKFDKLTVMASEHICLGPKSNRFNVEDSLAESNQTPLKEDLDDLFGLLYEEYYEVSKPEVSTNSAELTTFNNENTPSSLKIIIDDNEAPPIVSTFEESTSPISNDIVDESI